ncbi:hypothetical protein PP1_027340 [Pseudonocardia sp. P1]
MTWRARVALAVPLRQHQRRHGDPPGLLDVRRGRWLPANSSAATIRGPRAIRTPIAVITPDQATGPCPGRAASTARHSGTDASTSGMTSRFDDGVGDGFARLQRTAQAGAGGVDAGQAGSTAAAGQLQGRGGVPIREAGPGPA